MRKRMEWFVFLTLTFCACASFGQGAGPSAANAVARNNTWYRRTTGNTTLVFVHGIFSDSAKCWTSVRGTYWPNLITKDHAFDGVGIYLAGYATRPTQRDYGVRDAAMEIFSHLKTDGVLDAPNIVFVCHSTGGIVVRYLLTDGHWTPYLSKNIGVALYASPSRGAPLADAVRLIAAALNQKLGGALSTKSELLADLHDRFFDFVTAHQNLNLVGMETCETEKIHGAGLVVPCDSAGSYFGSVQRLPRKNHFETVKPDSLQDDSNVALENFFTQRFKALVALTDSTIPMIACVRPTSGVASGGYKIVITGDDFRPGVQVDIDGVSLTKMKVESSAITGIVPSHATAGTVSLGVRNPLSNKATTAFTYQPLITSVSPSIMDVTGGTIVVSGSGFTTPEMVSVCGHAATDVKVLGTEELRATVSSVVVAERCGVMVDLGSGMRAELNGAIRFDPVVSSIAPSQTSIISPGVATVAGVGFPKGSKVLIGNLEAGVRYDSPTEVTISLPPEASTGVYDVKIVTPDGGGAKLDHAIVYCAAISRTTAATAPGSPDDIVTIAGAGFAKTVRVSIGDQSFPGESSDGKTIQIKLPAPTTEVTVGVTVDNLDGSTASCSNCLLLPGVLQPGSNGNSH